MKRKPPSVTAATTPAPAALLERATDFYHDELLDSPGLDFLRKQNMADPDLLQTFRIGWCGGRLVQTLPPPGENGPHADLTRVGILLPDGSERFLNCLAEQRLIFVNPGDKFIIPKPDRCLLPVPSVEDVEHGRPKLMAGHPEHDRLWVGAMGEKLGGAAVRLRVRNHARSAGIQMPVSPHTLRRACATHMLRNGAHPAQIRMLLGHSDFKTLSQYLRVSITDLKRMHEKSKPGQ